MATSQVHCGLSRQVVDGVQGIGDLQMPQRRARGITAAKKAAPQHSGKVIGHSGTIKPRISKPTIQTARLDFSTPTSRWQVWQ